MIKCADLAFKVTDSVLVKLAKVLPNGMNEISSFFGFQSCSNSADIFHHIISTLEPVVYVILSLFGGV